ncbi:CGI-121-domain-containing protein [Fistulina hepatica ATCC 64428]|uniref:EKC/KEOPS complex subunit CGI121 n=1 Tax=Fistulina hepatica ATCC 64428 TaxID=1128425 RepID=A0A0D7A278_9AGAR|nr:CGI-121-domain-containing protein [Fistulina hepatica ATCC 64428]
METITFPHFPDHLSVAHVALYTNVRNGASLKARIVKAATDEGADGDRERHAVNFAFIDARLITSPLHLRTAIQQAIISAADDALRTKSVHSEILWALNPTNNISEALRRYGVSDTTTALLVVRICGRSDVGANAMRMQAEAVVQGDLVPLSHLAELTDWAYHKLNNEPSVGDDHAVIDNIVVSTVAVKSVM